MDTILQNKLIQHIFAFDWQLVQDDLKAGANVNYRKFCKDNDAASKTPIELCILSIFMGTLRRGVKLADYVDNGIRTLQVLLDYEPDMNTGDEYDMTPVMFLFKVSFDGHVVMNETGQELRRNIFDMLMTKKHVMNFEKKDCRGMTALTHACAAQCPYCVRRLVEVGINVNSCDGHMKRTPLHHLCQAPDPVDGLVDCIEWMVTSAGADINAQDDHGFTPLMLLFGRNGKREDVLIRLMQNTGPDLTLTNKNGQMISSFAGPRAKAWIENALQEYVLK
jgi:ankyrin repeat protein